MMIFSNIYTSTDEMTCIKAILCFLKNIKLGFGNLPGIPRYSKTAWFFPDTLNWNQLAAFLSCTKYFTNTFGNKG